MINISDVNVDISEDELPKVLRIVANDGSGADIYRAGILTTKGKPVSERQSRRYREQAEKIIETLDPEVLANFIDMEYNPYSVDEVINETTSYPTVVVEQELNRSVVFDIEVLSPSFNNMGKYSHFMLCASFLPLDTGEVYTLKMEYEDQRDDRRLIRDVVQELTKYQFIIGHNVKGYDINWLHTRLMFYGWPTPPELRLFYYDTYSACRRIPIQHRKGLGNLLDFFRIRDAEKTRIMPIEWDRIRSPHVGDFEAAMVDVVYHCEQDVISNRKIYDILINKRLRYDRKPGWTLWPN